MGWFTKWLGAGVGSTVKDISDVVDKYVQTDDEKAAVQQVFARMAQNTDAAQVEINKIGAANRSVFVAGWRPYIGWVAGTSLAMYFLPQYFMAAILWTKASWAVIAIWQAGTPLTLPAYPVDAQGLMELVLGMLGLGAARTIEKLTGVAK